MNLDVVAFSPHPDDAEIFCGGTLYKMAKKGYKVAIVDMTEGERGTRGDRNTRAYEAELASKVLGLCHRENLRIPDTEILPTLSNRNKIIEVIRRLRPRVVIAPYIKGRHPDHNNASALIYDACFFSGLKNYPMQEEPSRPFKILYAIRCKEYFPPSFIVDISDEFEKKLEAIRCYRSQFLNPDDISQKTETVFERITTFAHFCGLLIGKRYGEAFFIKEAIEIEDPVKMTVSSFL